jgi:hypothetical protein
MTPDDIFNFIEIIKVGVLTGVVCLFGLVVIAAIIRGHP